MNTEDRAEPRERMNSQALEIAKTSHWNTDRDEPREKEPDPRGDELDQTEKPAPDPVSPLDPFVNTETTSSLKLDAVSVAPDLGRIFTVNGLSR